jgi:signal transduction histidine kinase
MERETIRILHAEDDEIDQRLVKRILFGSPQPAEFALEQVDRISLAVEYLSNKEKEFDITLIDLGLPDASGIESVQMIKQANPDIPIVVLTGTTDKEIGLEAIKNGAMDYLSKGIALEELLVRTILYALERKKAERKIKEAVEAKSEFLSIVSHELRTPLTAMKESVAIVLDGMTGEINDEQRSCLDIARRNIDRLSRLINDVLDVQKLEAGKMKFDMKVSDINEVAEHVYKTMASPAKEKGIDLILELDGKLPKVEFDMDRIAQVLTNLVNNAFKFTEKGSVKIKTGKEENAIQVSVSDSGCGIKQEDMPKLFRKFEQLADSGERKTGGTGLGLAICKEIIEEHKGDIWVESEMDKGSTFRFVLPIREKGKVCRKES